LVFIYPSFLFNKNFKVLLETAKKHFLLCLLTEKKTPQALPVWFKVTRYVTIMKILNTGNAGSQEIYL